MAMRASVDTATDVHPAKKKIYHSLYIQVLVGLVLGILVGYIWPDFGASLKVLGDGFIRLVKMMIAPIVFCTIVLGVTNMSEKRGVGKTLLKAMGLFLCTYNYRPGDWACFRLHHETR